MAARNMAQSEKCSPHKPASLSMVSNIWHEKPGVLTPACSASAGKAEKGHPGRAGQLVQLNWWALGLMRDTVLKVRQWVTKEDPKSPLASTHLHAHAQTPHKHAHRDDKSIFHIGRSYPQIQVQSRISKPQTWSAPSLKHLPKTNKCTACVCWLPWPLWYGLCTSDCKKGSTPRPGEALPTGRALRPLRVISVACVTVDKVIRKTLVISFYLALCLQDEGLTSGKWALIWK